MMHVHLYTSFANVAGLHKGEVANVWTKQEAASTDVHISLEIGKYAIEHISGGVFKAYKN